MVLPGYGIGDVIEVTKLAHSFYKRCRDSPGQYKKLSAETRQLANVLSDCEDMVRKKRIPPDKAGELLQHAQEVKTLLLELEERLRKYESLSTKSKVTFDRLKWDQHEAESARSQISSRVTMLNSVYPTVVASGQYMIQLALDQIVQDLRSGHKDLDAVSSSLSAEDSVRQEDPVWHDIIGDLELQGVPLPTIQENDTLIVERIRGAAESIMSTSAVGSDAGSDAGSVQVSSHTDLILAAKDTPGPGIMNLPMRPRHRQLAMMETLTVQDISLAAPSIVADWNRGDRKTAADTMLVLVDRPCDQECRTSQLLMRLMRSVHFALQDDTMPALAGLCSLFQEGVELYTFKPIIIDRWERAIFISAAY